MKRDNCSPEMEMLLLAELISYPYHLRQISPDSLIPLVMDPMARKVLDVLIVMKNNDEEVSLSNVSYHLSDQQVIERLTNSFLKVATDSPIQQHIGYLKELSVNRILEQLALNILGMSKDLTTPSSEKLSKIINESSQISEVTKSLKRLAKDCRCPVVLLCQLNRNNVRDGRPPDLQDLRDSGSIEQDADIVLIIERIKTGGVNLWLRKNRMADPVYGGGRGLANIFNM